MYFEERGYNDVNWIHQAQVRVQWQDLVNTIMTFHVP
jgi:hypothetical protein